MLIRSPRILRISPRAASAGPSPSNRTSPASIWPGLRDEPHDRERGHALAAARLADEAHDLAAVDVEVDAVDRADDAVARVERGPQALDLEQRPSPRCASAARGRDDLLDDRLRRRTCRGRASIGLVLATLAAPLRASRAAHRFSRGSSASRSPSPSRLKREDGERDRDARDQDDVRRAEQLVALEADHRAPFGAATSPVTPTNARAAISRTAPPTPSVPATMSGVIELGMIRRTRIPKPRFAEGPRRRHEVGLARREHGRAHDPGVDRYRRRCAIASSALTRLRPSAVTIAIARSRARERQQHVHEPHQDVVAACRPVARDRADDRADDDRERRRRRSPRSATSGRRRRPG